MACPKRTLAGATPRTIERRERQMKIRPLGGRLGCLAMIAFSVFASVLLTVLLNIIL